MSIRNVALLWLLVLLVSPAIPQNGTGKQKLAKEYQSLEKQYYDALDQYYKPYEDAKTEEDRAKIKLDPAQNPAKKFLPRFLEFRKKVAKDMELGPQVESQTLNVAEASGDKKRVKECLDNLATKFAKSPSLDRYMYQFSQGCYYLGTGREGAISYLRKVEANATSKNVKAAALYQLAEQMTPSYGSKGDIKKARETFLQVKAKYPDTRHAKLVESAVFEIDNLQVGMVAPDFQIEDENGVSWKLSDYRGKVVVVDFWGFW